MLIDEYGGPRLADLGQARFVDLDLTRSGDITATPGFVAPEVIEVIQVIQGQPATPAADVYSLAATVMALVLGRALFDAAGDESVRPGAVPGALRTPAGPASPRRAGPGRSRPRGGDGEGPGAATGLRALTAPAPRQNLVARDLILGPVELPGDGWQLDPDIDRTLTPLLGDSSVLECLDLPVVADGESDVGTLLARDRQTSEVYMLPGVSVQTAGVIASSPARATDIATALRPPGFDLCRDDFSSFAQRLDRSEDSVDCSVDPTYSEPPLPELPEVVTGSAVRIDVLLSDSAGDVDSYVVEYVLLAAGTTVAGLGIWSYGQAVDSGLRTAVVQELVGLLTD